MDKHEYLPPIQDMVEYEYRDKILKLFNDAFVSYYYDCKTNLIYNSDYNASNSIIVYNKSRDEDTLPNLILINTEYEERTSYKIYKYNTFYDTKECIRDIKNGITIKLPFCKIELALSGKIECPYDMNSLFLDIVVKSSDGHLNTHSIGVEDVIGDDYDPNNYHDILTTFDRSNNWSYKFINGNFDIVRKLIDKHYKHNKNVIDVYNRIFKSLSLSTLHIFEIIKYKWYKD